MPEESEQDTAENDTLFESFIARIQNHPVLALVLLLAAAVIGIASFSDAVENLLGKTQKAFGTDGELVLLLEDAEATNIGFSLVASKASFEIRVSGARFGASHGRGGSDHSNGWPL